MIAENIRRIFKENMIEPEYIDALSDDESFDSLDLNSIASIKIIVQIEDTFHIEFNHEHLDLHSFMSIKDIASYVEKKLEEK